MSFIDKIIFNIKGVCLHLKIYSAINNNKLVLPNNKHLKIDGKNDESKTVPFEKHKK